MRVNGKNRKLYRCASTQVIGKDDKRGSLSADAWSARAGKCRRNARVARTLPVVGKGKAMAFMQANTTISVDLAVARYRTFPEDGLVEVWGHMGDYEVCVHLPLDDARVRPLLVQAERSATGRSPSRPSRAVRKRDIGG